MIEAARRGVRPQSGATLRDFWGRASLALLVALVLDLLTKQWVLNAVPINTVVPIGPFAITHLENSGIAFGLFPQFGLLLQLVGLGGVTWLIARQDTGSWVPALAGGAMLGGALGNSANRIWHGAVIDFIEVQRCPVPVFNVADLFVVLGSLTLVLFQGWLWMHQRHSLPIAPRR